jgi:phytoene/squalene synthetase
LLLPAWLRPAAVALGALNVETARVLDAGGAQRDAQLQRLRLRWWRDALGGALGDGESEEKLQKAAQSGASPVLAALAAAFPPGSAARPHACRALGRLLQSREADAALTGAPPPSLEALETYSRATGGALLTALMHAAAAGARGDGDCAGADAVAAAEAVGGGASLAALLRGSLAHAQRGRLYLPSDGGDSRAALTPHQLLRPDGGGDAARRGVRSVAELAAELLAQGRLRSAALGRGERLVLLPAVSAQRYLDALAREEWDAPALARQRGGGMGSPLASQLALAWAAARGRI